MKMPAMLVPITANQAHVLRMLVETMTPQTHPGLEVVDFEDAWAIHAALATAKPMTSEHEMTDPRGYKLTPKQPGLPVRYFAATHRSQPMARIAESLYECEVMGHADYMKAIADGVKIEDVKTNGPGPVQP